MILNSGDKIVASRCLPRHKILGNIHLGEVFICVSPSDGMKVTVRRLVKSKPWGPFGRISVNDFRPYQKTK